MPLKLIHGPPNSGRAGLIRAALRRRPGPQPDPGRAQRRRRLRLRARALRRAGGAGWRSDDLRGAVPHGRRRTAARRRGPSSLPRSGCGRSRSRSRRRLGRLGPLRRSASRPGFARAFARLLDELQAAGVEPGAVEASAATLEGSAYLSDIATLFAGYAAVRDRSGRVDAHGIAREAIELLRRRRGLLGRAPGLPLRVRRPHSQPVRAGRGAGRTDRGDGRASLRGGQRGAGRPRPPARRAARGGSARSRRPGPWPRRPAPRARCSSTCARSSAPPRRRAAGPGRGPATAALGRRAGRGRGDRRRGLEADRCRRPTRRRSRSPCATRRGAGPAIAAALEANGVATALEAELPVAGTAVGGALVALLEAEFGTRPRQRRAALPARPVRLLAGPGRLARAGAAAWPGRGRGDGIGPMAGRGGRATARPGAGARGRGTLGGGARERGRATGGDDGRAAAARRRRRTRASVPATGWSCAPPPRSPAPSASWPSSATLAPGPDELAATIAGLEFRVWSGPVEGRVRIASPYRLRAGRFDHVFVALAPGRRVPAPRPRRRPLPLRSAAGLARARPAARQRGRGALPVRGLPLAAAPAPLPLLPRQRRERRRRSRARRCSTTCGRCWRRRPTAPRRTRSRRRSPAARDLARVVAPLAEAPSEDELARALAVARRRRRPGHAARRGRGRRRARLAPAGADRRRARGRGRLAGAGAADQPGGDRVAGRGPGLRRHHPGAASTSAPTAGSSATSSTRSRSTRCPTRWSRAG